MARTAGEVTGLAIGRGPRGTLGVGTLVYAPRVGPASRAALAVFFNRRADPR